MLISTQRTEQFPYKTDSRLASTEQFVPAGVCVWNGNVQELLELIDDGNEWGTLTVTILASTNCIKSSKQADKCSFGEFVRVPIEG